MFIEIFHYIHAFYLRISFEIDNRTKNVLINVYTILHNVNNSGKSILNSWCVQNIFNVLLCNNYFLCNMKHCVIWCNENSKFLLICNCTSCSSLRFAASSGHRKCVLAFNMLQMKIKTKKKNVEMVNIVQHQIGIGKLIKWFCVCVCVLLHL